MKRSGVQCNIRALQVFESVYRLRSVAKACEELSITRSAVSHQIRYLRTQIGEDLIEKTGRTLVFTERGEKLAQSLGFAFMHIEDSVENSIKGSSAALRVAVCTAFGSGWLIPRVSKFARAKDSRLQILLHAYQPDLSDTVADVFFTTTPLQAGYWSVKLLSERLVPVVEPSFNALDSAEGLTLITTDLDKRTFMEDWIDYLKLIGRSDFLQNYSSLGTSHYSFAIQMAEEGAGIALVPHFVAERRVAAGALKLWHDTQMPSGRDYFLNVKHARRHEVEIKAFVSWIRRDIATYSRISLDKRCA